MHKIVLTIFQMLTDLIVLWEDRYGDNFKIKMFELSDLKVIRTNYCEGLCHRQYVF